HRAVKRSGETSVTLARKRLLNLHLSVLHLHRHVHALHLGVRRFFRKSHCRLQSATDCRTSGVPAKRVHRRAHHAAIAVVPDYSMAVVPRAFSSALEILHQPTVAILTFHVTAQAVSAHEPALPDPEVTRVVTEKVPRIARDS